MDMTKFELNQIDVNGDGRIILYQRPDTKNPKWQARISVRGSTGYKVFSTKEVDRKDAERIALDKYEELYFKVRRGGTLKGKPFNTVYNEWKKTFYEPTQHDEQSIRKVEVLGLEFFKTKPIDEITEGDLHDMMETLKPKNFKTQTIRQYRTATNNLFQYAKTKGYVEDIPEIPAPSLIRNRRPDFNKNDWQKLYTYMRTWLETPRKGSNSDEPDAKRFRERLYLQNYILILANTGIRIGEIRNLRWSDIDKVEIESGDERLVFQVSGKTGRRDAVGNAGVDVYIRRLWDHRCKELGFEPNMSEFVFCKPDGSKVGSYKKGFISLLEGCGLRVDQFTGQNRTLYSLRHTYATMRINEVPVYQLAVNMGTSVEMIELYYSHARTRSPEFAKTVTKGNQTSEGRTLPFL